MKPGKPRSGSYWGIWLRKLRVAVRLVGLTHISPAVMAFTMVGCAIVYCMLLPFNGLDSQERSVISLTLTLSLLMLWIVYRSEIERRRSQKNANELSALFHSTLRALTAAIDARDSHDSGHVGVVEFVACEIARQMNNSATDMEGLCTAALLLDVGTLAVPENILLQRGLPSPEEFASIHNHPVIGAQILEGIKFPWPVQSAVRAHHERWDGSGYPDGLAGPCIPLAARILAVADVYSALTCDRAYRRSWPHRQAVEHIRTMSGILFDPAVVDAFLKVEENIQLHRNDANGEQPYRASATISRINQQFVALWEISRSAGSSLDLRSTLEIVGAKAANFLKCDAWAVFLNSESHEIVCEAYFPETCSGFHGSRISPAGPGAGRAIREKRPVILRASSEHMMDSNGKPVILAYDWAAIAPLRSEKSDLGAIVLYRRGQDFSVEEMDLLDSIARHASVPIANANLYQATRDSADRDPLTGLYNLRHFCAQMDIEVARSSRRGRSFSLIAIDLDRFKMVNDTLGHQAGDALLRDVARLFTSTVREYDVVVRYGGDEFVIILPDADEKEAEETAGRLRASVEEYTANLSALSTIGFGASFGWSTYPMDGTTAEAMLAAADKRMYENKRLRKKDRAA